MISLDVKSETSASSTAGLSKTTDEEPTLSFSELLKGASDKKDGKVIQNGALILSLGGDEKATKVVKGSAKNDALLSLLKNDEGVLSESKEPLELNPKLTQSLTTKEIKVLVSDAKEYLKTKILQSDDYKRSEIKELPKTLKGLATLAEKFGVDVSKITMEEVQSKPLPKDIKTLSSLTQAEDSDKKEIRADVKKEIKADTKTQNSNSEIIQKTAVNVSDKDTKVQKIVEDVKDLKKDVTEHVKVDAKRVEVVKEVKSTPLFKAQTQTEHTTEQIVQAKQFKVEEKTPKQKADETLKLLLRGEKPAQTGVNLTADFSVATARVIAPTATTDVTKSLEVLLHGEQSESNTASKIDGLTTHKADSFEVKLNEAKQMIKYLSQDVKTAIEDYKSPFTRVKLQLNPQKLGEVDLTVIQRGKNLHVNISSNNTAINTLAMNANELKVQLGNSGINNATLNFNSGSENGSSSNEHQQNRQNEQKQASEEYNYFENEEQNEEILSSLEIVVPSYA